MGNNRVQAAGEDNTTSDFVASISNVFTACTAPTPSPSAPSEEHNADYVIPEVVAEPISSSAAQPATATAANKGGATATAAAATATATKGKNSTFGSVFGGLFGGDDEI